MPRTQRRATALLALATLLGLASLPGNARAQGDFVFFESGPVHPIALSPDGTRLFVTNIPDGHLEVYDLLAPRWSLPVASIPVGLEPVAVLPLSNDEAWVVNHLSDSVSIVSVSAGRVIRTLLVGDEPRDIVVADPPGATGPRVFVSTAHRGQHRSHSSIAAVPGAGDPQLSTPGVGRADVWIFDPNDLGASLGGTPLAIASFFADTPRGLAVSADGSEVYVAAFHSGNGSTAVSEGVVCDGFGTTPCDGDGITSPGGLSGGDLPGGLPGPDDNHSGVGAPEVGLIVQWNEAAGEFQDDLGRNWNNGVRFSLPDRDVFAIDVETLGEKAFHTGVGTLLFNLAVNPASGKLYVSNTEAKNLTRFEGSGDHGGSTVQGHLAESSITVIDTPGSSGSAVTRRHLNKHIDYSILPAPPGTADRSLATPLEMAISADGETLYVAAFGSSKVGVFSTAALEDDSFVPDSGSHIAVSGGGPGGLALSANGELLYVYTRFDNGVSVIHTATQTEIEHWQLPNPEPADVADGRPFLYDAHNTSSNGEASCSSCHAFGDMDDLAWDLGDPDGDVTPNPIPFEFSSVLEFIPQFLGLPVELNGEATDFEFHPMKGPMTTQTLRGLSNSGAMHWRGDRSVGVFGTSATDEALSFNNFLVAFPGLLGQASPISATDMQEFTDFALALALPPNPQAGLDNSLDADAQAGADFFSGPRRSDGLSTDPLSGIVLGFNCDGCHRINPLVGQFGTSTRGSFENESQIFKVPQLRNMYQKVGMFGMPETSFELPGDNGFKGDQIRGFGFLHDGSTDTLFRFFRATVFDGNADPDTGFENDTQREQMEAFMMAFPTDLAPITGQQITLSAGNGAVTNPRIDLLIRRADAPFTSEILGGLTTECQLIAKAQVGGEPMGWLYVTGGVSSGVFLTSDGGVITDADLRALASSTDVTFSCVPPGSGQRMGRNRDRDTVLDSLDNCPGVPNDDQSDGDGDLLGDACDPTPLPEPGASLLLFCGALALLGCSSLRRRTV